MGVESGGPSLNYKFLRKNAWYRKFRIVPTVGYVLSIILSALHAYGREISGEFDWGSFVVLSLLGFGLFYCIKFSIVTIKYGKKAYVTPWGK
jgi:hypothetical protein